MSKQFSLLATVLRALLGAGGMMFLLGPMLLPETFRSPYLSAAGLGLLIGLVLHAGLQPGFRSSKHGVRRSDASFDDHLESLHDRQWEMREAEGRYRDLLDLQSNIVLKRDAQGRLAYVNRAFCDTFGVGREDVLGTDFNPAVLEQEEPEAQADGELSHPRRFSQRLETAAGPRWVAWEELTSLAPGGGGVDVLWVGRDITDERAVVSMLSRAREQAEEEGRQTSHVLTALSRGFRQQTASICDLSDELTATLQPSEQKSHARDIGDTARVLLELADQVVELSEIEVGRAKMELAPFNLEHCIQEIAELTAPKAYERGLQLAWTLDAGVPDDIAGDEARIRRIVLNLVSNTVETTRHGGVLISAGLARAPADQMRVAIRIESTSADLDADAGFELALARRLARAMGGGVAVEAGPRQVSAFTLDLPLPLDAPTAAASSAERCVPPIRVLICSSLRVEAQALAAELSLVGAHVTVIENDQSESAISKAASASEALDLIFVDGATSPELAAVLLACAKEQSPGKRVRGCVLVTGRQVEQLDAFRVAGVEDYLVRPVRRSSLREMLGLRAQAEGAGSLPPRVPNDPTRDLAPGRHVLIAEDNPVNAVLTQCMVRRAGCTATLVETGRAAVAAVRYSLEGKGPAIDLVLMDVHMPDLDGIAAAREIRRLSDQSRGRSATGRSCPPLIAITANAFAEDRRSCLAAGMDDYLAKPFTWPEFKAVLARWIPHTRYMDSSFDPNHRAA